MHWLDPDTVPTMGDWFRAAGYRTHYRGKWHISHPDLRRSRAPTRACGSNDADGVRRPRRGRRLPPGRPPRPVRLLGVDRSRAARRRQGRHRVRARRRVRASRSSTCSGELARADDDAPVAGGGVVREPARHRVHRLRRGSSSASRPIRRLDSRRAGGAVAVRLVRRPPRLPAPVPGGVAEGPLRAGHRRRRTAASTTSSTCSSTPRSCASSTSSHARGLADDTIVVFTSDHGDLLGAHGGLHAEVAQRVRRGDPRPAARVGPGRRHRRGGRRTSPTSHVDLSRRCSASPASTWKPRRPRCRGITSRPSPSSDATSAGCSRARTTEAALDAPMYFMTEDQITPGLRTINLFTGEAVRAGGRAGEGRVGDRAAADGRRRRARAVEAATTTTTGSTTPTTWRQPWELHNLTVDPEERVNLAVDTDSATAFGRAAHRARPHACRDAAGPRSTSTPVALADLGTLRASTTGTRSSASHVGARRATVPRYLIIASYTARG